jgi:2-dehydro-3-deoxygluconokinase
MGHSRVPESFDDFFRLFYIEVHQIGNDVRFHRFKPPDEIRVLLPMAELCKYVDVCIANKEDASDIFGIHAADTDVNSGKLSPETYRSVAAQLAGRFGFSKTAITLRESNSANDNNWSAILYDGDACCISRKYLIHIVDHKGGEDSFGAGLIYAMHHGYSSQETIEFAAAASCLKQSIEVDYNMVTVSDVKNLAGGNASGRVQR